MANRPAKLDYATPGTECGRRPISQRGSFWVFIVVLVSLLVAAIIDMGRWTVILALLAGVGCAAAVFYEVNRVGDGTFAD